VNSRKIGDTWAFGYTPDLVAGVWAGNADNSPMVNITSTRISWRSWRDFMTFAHDQLQIAPAPFTNPGGVEARELCWPSGKLPTEHCPASGRYTGLFASDVLGGEDLERLQDTWWRPVDIDTRTGLLATPLTPAAFVSREVRLVLPEDEIKEWTGLDAWAAATGVTSQLAPTEDTSEAGAPLLVAAPAATQTVSGLLRISGRASSPQFQSYTVEWGRGVEPASWVRIHQSNRRVIGGVLASWDTTLVPNGPYTLRVRLQDEQRGMLRFTVPVVVDNGAVGAQADTAPFAQITSPQAGSVLSGRVALGGLAFSGALQEVGIEVGLGLQPTEWTILRRDSQASVTGQLGFWDTTAVEDGVYTLRLSVRDALLGTAEALVVVTVKNGD
jgi:hypothetical protein